MAKILVSGLINIETTVRVDEFPVTYVPSRYPFFGVNSTVSGVGYNITKALTTLGHEVRFLSLVGDDMHGQWVQQSIRDLGVDTHYVLPTMQGTSQSVILYTPNGQRMIHVDLKDAQDQTYPIKTFKKQYKIVTLRFCVT
jgi:sugar/nucleoside kinase (ribokinase family)